VVRHPGRYVRGGACRGLRGRPPRHPPRRQAVPRPGQLRGQPAQDPSLPQALGRRRLPLSCHPPHGSFPDTDPFEPQAGGCCSILPYFIDDLVELPITLVQDHTLWEILDDESLDRWTAKSEWIAANRGLIQLLVHPDYLLSDARLALYDSFLEWLSALIHRGGGWHALPRQVAEWWRQRAALSCSTAQSGEVRIEGGPGAERAVVGWAAAAEDGDVVLELSAAS
jgi:hypothetical protein